jgi:hypothetical protein
VTHLDCIATLLVLGGAGAPAGGPSAAARERASEHAARCSDCWAVLALLHDLALGEPPAEAARMQALYGCDPVQDALYLLEGLTAADVRRRHPDVARHLGWCLACRGRLAEILVVAREAAGGAYGPPLLARATDAVRRVLVRLRHAAAVFAEVPADFTLVPVPAAAVRGRASAAAEPRRLRFALPGSGLRVELTLEPATPARVGMTLVFPDGADGVVVQLRGAGAGSALLARHTVRGAEPVLVRDLPAGPYLLEIAEREAAPGFRLRLDVEAAA